MKNPEYPYYVQLKWYIDKAHYKECFVEASSGLEASRKAMALLPENVRLYAAPTVSCLWRTDYAEA